MTSRVENIDTNVNVLRRLIDYVGENEKPLRAAADVIREAAKKEFDSEGGYGGSPWEPLTESTEKSRERALRKFGGTYGPAHPILYRTGSLMRSWSEKRSPAHYQKIDKKRAEVGSMMGTPKGKWNLAWIHHEGTRRGLIPARPMFGPAGELPDQDQNRIREIFEKHLDDFFKKAS